ncbi:MAG: PDZ domain-containing protein [Chloroflexi bacterium]|nr:PDZ domain-containing protein [Chloroflexota bacterium]
MTEKTQTLEINQTVKAPLSQVYRAFTNDVALESWLGDTVEADAKDGGRFYVWWEPASYTSGVYKEVKKKKLVSFTWHGSGEPHPTEVKVLLAKNNNEVLIALTHSGIGTGKDWDGKSEYYQEKWEAALQNLKSVLEKGIDKRVFDRPMTGVYLGELITPELAKMRGLPENFGIVLSETVEGLAAANAGLKKDEIILSIGGIDLRTYRDYSSAMRKHKAGDVVEVLYVRDNEKHSFQMELSARPINKYPPTAKELTDKLRKVYAELDKEIAEIFNGVSDEEAAQRPEPEEWSARETVAHLIITERWSQLNLTNQVASKRSGGYYNDLIVHAAVANAYPTNAELINELKRSEEVMLHAVEALPADFVSRKRDYHILAELLLFDLPHHSKSHFDQMRNGIEAARRQ